MTSNTKTAKKSVTARRKPETAMTRIATVRHRKADVNEVVTPAEDRHATIAKIAYGYWEMRGYQGGDPAADWFRAEEEYANRQAASTATASV